MKFFFVFMDPNKLCLGKGLVLLNNFNINQIDTHLPNRLPLTQARFLPSTSVAVTTSSESQPHIPLKDTAPTKSNSLYISVAPPSFSNALSSSTISKLSAFLAETSHVLEIAIIISNTIPSAFQASKQTSKTRKKKRPNKAFNDVAIPPLKPKTEKNDTT
ncbi:hypothetical protein TNCV_2835871 [Trichonephila clavipes]|nr:hypothetical protein TNCV_2835871 [Trichonephila clavipes]